MTFFEKKSPAALSEPKKRGAQLTTFL